MTVPERVQLSRRKGWRMPENTVSVARPGPFGNPYRVVFDELWNGGRINALTGEPMVMNGPWWTQMPKADGSESTGGFWFRTRAEAMAQAVALFRLRVEALNIGKPVLARLPELRGKNLACWCPLDQPCHADVLLDLANREPEF